MVVCGGFGGVMKVVCCGVKDVGGMIIGVLLGEDCEDVNFYVDIFIVIGFGYVRNVFVVMNGDVVIVVDGGGGMFFEIGYVNVFDCLMVGIRI